MGIRARLRIKKPKACFAWDGSRGDIMKARSSWPRTALAVVALCGGCQGQIGVGNGATGSNSGGSSGSAIGKDGGPRTAPTATATGACLAASSRTVRRLSEREYLNVVTDLLGAQFAAVAGPMFPFEPRVAGFDNQDNALLVSSAFQEALANAAEKISGMVDTTTLAPCATAASSTSCLSSFVQGFARKAFGRGPTAGEVQNLLAVAALGTSYANSVQLIVEEILQSPQMLYVSELGPDAPKSGPTAALTQQEIASQLSFLLTGARPDEQLLQAADQGHLASTADIKAQVARLLTTPRATEQLRLFVNGWVDMGPVAEAPKDTLAFPAFTPDLVAAMQEEFDAFVDSNVAAGQGTLSTLMSATSAHIPAGLASLYGPELIGAPGGSQMLDPKHRRGILSLPALLTYHSADTHSGPIERGLLVRRQLLCQAIPPPPASVLQQLAANPINTSDTTRTTRMVYEQHKTQPSCSSCHSQFDVIGFGMEEMDGLGRYRTTENALPVDTSGQLNNTDVDGPFNGVADLSGKLAGSQMFAACFVQQFFRFAETRAPLATDQCTLDTWGKAFHNGGEHVNDLIASYVSDPGFATREEDR
jgi:hypothetical protein